MADTPAPTNNVITEKNIATAIRLPNTLPWRSQRARASSSNQFSPQRKGSGSAIAAAINPAVCEPQKVQAAPPRKHASSGPLATLPQRPKNNGNRANGENTTSTNGARHSGL